MKRKVKKFSEGGTNIRTRTDAEFAEDSKHGGYGRYMPKTKEYTLDEAKEKISGLFGGKSKAKEEAALDEKRPIAKSSFGYEDMDGRMPAESTWSGDQSPKAKTKAAPEPEEAPKAKVEGPFAGFDAEKALKESKPTGGGSTSTTGGKDSGGGGGGSKASGAKVKKASLPSNPKADLYDTSGNKRTSGDSQSFAPPPRSGMGPKNTFLTKERMKVDDTSGGSHLANEFKRRPRAKDDEDYTTKKKRERAGKDVRANSAVYGMKKGGAVKSASARADGIAIRGKTRA
jgi:hypothetical protein